MSQDDCGSGGSLTFMVRKVWLSMRASIGEVLADFGLTSSQYATLMMTQRQPGMSVSDIAREVGSTRQAANEMLASLEKDGLIERHPHPTDRRTHQIAITEKGRAVYRKAHAAVGRREAELEAGFTPEQRALIREWLGGMAEACR
ncbi:MarR family winged helix-turn-helix transcriptional regulator [Nocardia sp. CDC160]|uniref:MarR family winged helix-turn-helix transcriptional regulator n=1 Tax=Nocardia sp. CDC160 TaxID=3112166 RepID=UPI002DBAA285|nr:MarR family transcriptional regulator [Nocardia sp. CDC160]MEC3917939.1 MarR family transcriptional regulator [Nocardia sp. CDC160]